MMLNEWVALIGVVTILGTALWFGWKVVRHH
jgi:hypothetical protein